MNAKNKNTFFLCAFCPFATILLGNSYFYPTLSFHVVVGGGKGALDLPHTPRVLDTHPEDVSLYNKKR